MKNAHASNPSRFLASASAAVSFYFLVLTAVFLTTGCAGDPDAVASASPRSPAQQPSSETAPEPTPEPETSPESEPVGHAPLVGTRWTLQRLHGDMRTLSPVSGPMWIEFRSDGRMFVQGPQNTIEGSYRHVPATESPKAAYNFEEGTLRGEDVIRNRKVGSFSEFEDVLLENLDLLKGYYIRGETPAESTLTIWGGYRSEEVVLLELVADGGAE